MKVRPFSFGDRATYVGTTGYLRGVSGKVLAGNEGDLHRAPGFTPTPVVWLPDDIVKRSMVSSPMSSKDEGWYLVQAEELRKEPPDYVVDWRRTA